MTTETLTLWTLVLTAAIVVVLATYLSGVAFYLLRASQHLDKLAAGLIRVRDNAKPLKERITTIAGALSALSGEFEHVDKNLERTADALGQKGSN